MFNLFKSDKQEEVLSQVTNLEYSLSEEIEILTDRMSDIEETLEETRLEHMEAIRKQNEDIAKLLFEIKESINDNNSLLTKKIDSLAKDISTDDIVGKLGNMFNKRTDHILNENNKASNIIASGISSVIKAIGERATADVKMGVLPNPTTTSNYNPSSSSIANNTVQAEAKIMPSSIEENSEEDAYNEIFAIQRKSRTRLPV